MVAAEVERGGHQQQAANRQGLGAHLALGRRKPAARNMRAVRISGKLVAESIACVFLDEDDAAGDVFAARAGDEDAFERLAERTLLWFALAEVLGR